MIGVLFLIHTSMLGTSSLRWGVLMVYVGMLAYHIRAFVAAQFGVQNKFISLLIGGVLQILLLGIVGSVLLTLFGFGVYAQSICVFVLSAAAIYTDLKYPHAEKSPKVEVKTTRLEVCLLILIACLYLSAIAALYVNLPVQIGIGSPWEVLNPLFLWLVFLLAIIIGLICISKVKSTYVLMVLIAFSLLVHAYIPVVHMLPAGADVWRHSAMEQLLLSGEQIYPVLFDNGQGSFGLTALLRTPQKFSYASLWAIIVFLAQVTQISVLVLQKWLIVILWSVLVPVGFYSVARKHTKNEYVARIIALTSFTSFPLLALGSLTLPISLSFLYVICIGVYMYTTLQEKKKLSHIVLVSIGIASLFLYVLVPIILGMFVTIYVSVEKIYTQKNVWLQRVSSGLLVGGMSAIILIIEAVTLRDYRIHPLETQVHNAVLFIKQITGLIFLEGWPIGDIAFGNILLSKLYYVSRVADVPFLHSSAQIFLHARIFVFVLISCLMISASVGLWHYLISKHLIKKCLAFISISLWVSYSIGWIFFVSEHNIIRRLDVFLSTIVLWFAVAGVIRIKTKIKKVAYQQYMYYVAPVSFALLFIAAYISGPYMRYVSVPEYNAAQFVVDALSDTPEESVCVIGNTWSLLALEYLSENSIVGGNFAIDTNFGQADRVRLYTALSTESLDAVRQEAQEITDRTHCYVIVTTDDFTDTARIKTNAMHSTQVLYSEPGIVVY